MTFDLAAAHAAIDQLGVEHAADVVAAVKAATDPLAAQHAADQAAIAARDQRIADLTARLAGLTPTRWGSSVYARPGIETYPQALARTVKALAPAFIRTFLTSTDALVWPKKTGAHPLLISFRRPPADVLAGRCDAEIRAFFAATPEWATPDAPADWCYMHEPEDDIERGDFTAQQYRDAWGHVSALAKASGKPLRANLILMGWTLTAKSGRAFADYFPGVAAVDVLGFDTYWHPGVAAADLYAPARAVSAQYGLPYGISETSAAANEATPAQRAQLLHDMAVDLATVEPRPVYVSLFDSNNDPRYQFLVTADPACVVGWNAGRGI